MTDTKSEYEELADIFQIFLNDKPINFEVINTSRGDSDFRETVIAELKDNKKIVIKLSDNDFTSSDKIHAWSKCADEYRKLGYYCPRILCSKDGSFPIVKYKGHNCVVYAEEYAKFNTVESRTNDTECDTRLRAQYMKSAFVMTAKIAAEKLDFTEYPSVYCLFDRFCPSDAVDEVLENALEWKKYAETLSDVFQEQVKRIWIRWNDNRKSLEQIYHDLPVSVFQADLNPSNLLIDNSENFVGIIDFNLCGKDVFLNYMLREICWYSDSEEELDYILDILKIVSEYYVFSDLEKRAVPLLYRCIKPLWYSKVEKLKNAANDVKAIRSCLDETEYMQTRVIDFEKYMN